jgi:hypothetical protein
MARMFTTQCVRNLRLEIAGRLRKVQDDSGMSGVEFAASIEVARTNWRRYLKGGVMPADVMLRLILAHDVDLEYDPEAAARSVIDAARFALAQIHAERYKRPRITRRVTSTPLREGTDRMLVRT